MADIAAVHLQSAANMINLENQTMGILGALVGTIQDKTGLCMAARRGDLAEVQQLLAQPGANPNVTHLEGWTALMYAADHGQLEVARALIRAGADLEARETVCRRTPLMQALREGKDAVAMELIAAGAAVNASDAYGETPLVYAMCKGNLAAVRALLDKGADVNARHIEQRTPLMLALAGGQQEAAAELVRAGADINARDETQQTPLHYAAGRGSTELVRLLLDGGADTAAQAKDGATPLTAALRGLGPQTGTGAAEALAAGGEGAYVKASFDALGSEAFQALRHCCRGDAALLKELLAAGVDPNTSGEPEDPTLLGEASRQGEAEAVRALLGAGAQPDALGPDGKSALMLALEHKGSAAVVGVLLGSPAARSLANQKDKDGVAVLELALQQDLPADTVRALLAAGADPNARLKGGATPLHLAVDLERVSLLQPLLDAGADPRATARFTVQACCLTYDSAVTPLKLAEARGRPEAVKVLKAAASAAAAAARR